MESEKKFTTFSLTLLDYIPSRTLSPKVMVNRKPQAPTGVLYTTEYGSAIVGTSEVLLNENRFNRFKNKVDLVFTSPPFPLNRKKRYGNLNEEIYLEWFVKQSVLLSSFLSSTGSIVIEMGNSWNKGSPTMSTLALRSMLEFLEAGNLHLCQQFVWFNTAKLPTPAPWVSIDRIRVKDAFTHIWWMSKTERPKADNRNVLNKYSKRMQKLLSSSNYNSGVRPSQHQISKSGFLSDNGGSIPPNVLVSSNTNSQSPYLKYCRSNKLEPHPARMPEDIPKFFIKLLTDPKDIVLDPYCGSNTTGQVCEELCRYWIGIDANENYLRGSVGRFKPKSSTPMLICNCLAKMP